MGQYQPAITAHEQAEKVFRSLEYQKGIAASLGSLGIAYYSLGQYQKAIDFYQQSLEIQPNRRCQRGSEFLGQSG